jgi:CubicO group peptidase (beta-lactamase class C family)
LDGAIGGEVSQLGVDRVASAAHVVVIREGELVADRWRGHTSLEADGQAVGPQTPYDLASVTKALVGATLSWIAIERGLLDAAQPLEPLLDELEIIWGDIEGWRAGATLLDVLNHSAGLAAWHMFYETWPVEPAREALEAQRAAIFARAASEPRAYAPGEGFIYSDLGYILLAYILERAFDEPLEELAQRLIFAPLQMGSARYVSQRRGDSLIVGAAATERCAYRRRVLVGEVHDENTATLGGVSVHAGVFSSAMDLARFGQHLLALERGALTSGILSPELVRWGWQRARGVSSRHVGGWDAPSGQNPSAGRHFDREQTRGHLGFTGTSLWIDRSRDVVAVLLTNRVYPSRENPLIHGLRVAIHEAIGA